MAAMARDTTAMAAACAVVTVTGLPVFLTGATAVQMRADLGFDAAGLGLAVASFFIAAAVASPPSGRMAERLGPAAGMRISSALAALSLGAVAVAARSLVVLVVCLVVGGLANAAAHPSSNLYLVRLIDPSRLGLALGAKQAAIPAGNLLAGLSVPLLALTVGWRWAFAAGALGAAVLAAVPPGGSRGVPAAGGGARRDTDPAARRALLVLAAAAALGGAAAGSLGSFLVSSAVDSGIRPGHAGLLASVCSAAGLVTRVLLGMQADRRGRGHLAVVIAMLASGSTGYLLIAVQQPPAVVIGALLAYCLGWSWPGLFNLAVVRSNPEAPGAATGITQMGTSTGAVVGPLLFGFVAERLSYSMAWVCSGGLSLAAAVTVVAGRRLLAHQERRRHAVVVPAVAP